MIHASVRSHPTSIERILRQAGKVSDADLAVAAALDARRGRRARRSSRARRRDHAARARATAPARDRERGVRAAVVAGRILLVRGARRRRRAARRAHPHLDRVAADGGRAPHRRVVAHRRQGAEPERGADARAGRGRPRVRARPAAARVGGADDDRHLARPARHRGGARPQRVRDREDRVRAACPPASSSCIRVPTARPSGEASLGAETDARARACGARRPRSPRKR